MYARTTSFPRGHNFRASRPQLLRGSDKNYFQALEINFKSLEIYFRGLEIYFRASEKVLFPAAKDFIPCRGDFYIAGEMILGQFLRLLLTFSVFSFADCLNNRKFAVVDNLRVCRFRHKRQLPIREEKKEKETQIQ